MICGINEENMVLDMYLWAPLKQDNGRDIKEVGDVIENKNIIILNESCLTTFK